MSRCSLSRHVQEHYFQRRATAGGLQMVQLTCSNATLRVLAGGHCCGGEAAIHPRMKGNSSSSNIGRYCPSAELSCGCRSRLTGTGGKRQDSVRLGFFGCVVQTAHAASSLENGYSSPISCSPLFHPALSLPLTSSEHTPRGPDMPIAQQPTAGPAFVKLFFLLLRFQFTCS